MKIQYYCPKCDSEHVEVYIKEVNKITVRLSMDDIHKQSEICPAHYTPLITVANCKNCGYTVEWDGK